jgi:hypothetical protein
MYYFLHFRNIFLIHKEILMNKVPLSTHNYYSGNYNTRISTNFKPSGTIVLFFFFMNNVYNIVSHVYIYIIYHCIKCYLF